MTVASSMPPVTLGRCKKAWGLGCGRPRDRPGTVTHSRVFDAARDKATPVVSVAGGGYAEPLSLTVTAYLNTLKALCEANGL